MMKVMCEVTIKDILGKNHIYKCCGFTQEDAEQKLLKKFPSDKIIKSVILYEYESKDLFFKNMKVRGKFC